MEIVVIGTEPPCIRCHTTFKRAKEVAQQFSEDIEVKKVPYIPKKWKNTERLKQVMASARKVI